MTMRKSVQDLFPGLVSKAVVDSMVDRALGWQLRFRKPQAFSVFYRLKQNLSPLTLDGLHLSRPPD